MTDDERTALRRRRVALRRERERDATILAYRVTLDEQGRVIDAKPMSAGPLHRDQFRMTLGGIG